MQNWQSKVRVEILADEVHMPKFETCLAAADVTHWTVRPLARAADNAFVRVVRVMSETESVL